ncbi:MAG: 50S ribosomal protein L30 [Chloroflexi bacterium]|nr:50S ribosomal protein L30 [Chloroflexota bacterium]
MTKLRVTYRKSSIGYSKDQKATIRSLGLRKLNSSVLHDDTPSIRGMLFKVKHLVSVEEVAAAGDALPEATDNLELVEGIGPKIARVLRNAGITTFTQLAALDPERISAILRAGNVRLAVTDTWPDQARLAAEGKWDDLTALQERLTAGRAE